MDTPNEQMEQRAFNTTTQFVEKLFNEMNKSTHRENLSQPLRTMNKQFKTAVTFLTGYNGVFNVVSKNNEFHSTTMTND